MIPCALFAVCGDPDGARREAQLPDYTTKKKHPHGSLIKDSIATKMKGYLFEDAFPKRIVNKIFDNSIS